MKLFSREVKNISELNEVLKSNKEISKEYEVAVIVYAFNIVCEKYSYLK